MESSVGSSVGDEKKVWDLGSGGCGPDEVGDEQEMLLAHCFATKEGHTRNASRSLKSACPSSELVPYSWFAGSS